LTPQSTPFIIELRLGDSRSDESTRRRPFRIPPAVGAMNDFAIIFQVLAGVVALFFIFLTYLNTKTWRWGHVTIVFLVFATSLTFCFYAAATLKTRATWIGLHDKTESEVEKTRVQVELVTRGDPKDPSAPSLVSIRAELTEVLIDRGRVWRGCAPSIDRATGAVTLTTTPAAAAGDPNLPAGAAVPAAGKKNNIQPKTVLHAFREGQIAGADGTPLVVPIAYIGEFEAAAVTDSSVTLQPTMPLAADQIQAGTGPGQNYLPSWTIYEVCPVDGHQWFDGTDEQRQVELSKIIPQPLLAAYLRDGREANANDPPEHVWVEVKFLKDYELMVDAPAATSTDTEPFNTEGQAVNPRLQNKDGAGKVQFGPEAPRIPFAVLDKQTADGLVASGTAEVVKSIFRRPLNDYERKLHGIYDRYVELTSRQRQLDTDNKALLVSIEKANEQGKLIEELNAKQKDDLQKTVLERDELKRYRDELANRVMVVQTELSQLYRANKVLARELAEMNARLTEEIENRARQATAMRP
jgi:hypothetical protein